MASIPAFTRYQRRPPPTPVKTTDADHTSLSRYVARELGAVADAIIVPHTLTVTADYDVPVRGVDVVLVNATTGVVQVRLPDPTRAAHGTYTVKKIDVSGNAVTVIATILPATLGTIDGATSVVLAAQWDKLTARSDGAQYYSI